MEAISNPEAAFERSKNALDLFRNHYTPDAVMPKVLSLYQTVLNALPKSVKAKPKEALHEIWMVETRADAQRAFDQFIHTYQDKYPKATECLEKNREELLAFNDFPAVHWHSLCNTTGTGCEDSSNSGK